MQAADCLHWSVHVSHLLLPFWSVNSGVGMLFACVTIGIFAYAYKTASFLGIQPPLPFASRANFAAAKCIGSFCSFVLMLIVMTYNMFLIGAILAGFFAAHYFARENAPMDVGLPSAGAYSTESEMLIGNAAL